MVKEKRKKHRHGRPITGDTFVTYLKFHRLTLGLTQERLAKKAGMSQGHYCEIERGIKRPSANQIEGLSLAINRPKDELVGKLYGVDPREMVTPGANAR